MTTTRKLPDDLLTKPYGNGVHNWAISIMQINPVVQKGIILAMATGFVHQLGQILDDSLKNAKQMLIN